MNRVWIGAAVCLAVVVGVMVNVQVVSADPAIVIKNDGLCGMPGSDEEGNFTFGGIGTQATKLENDSKVMMKCRGSDLANASGRAQVFEGFACGLVNSDGEVIVTEDTHATVAANGTGSMTCIFDK